MKRGDPRPVSAAIYARKSTAQAGREDDDKSVTRQIENARAFAAAKGWRVDDAHIYFDDAVSGAEIAKLQTGNQFLVTVERPAGATGRLGPLSISPPSGMKVGKITRMEARK